MYYTGGWGVREREREKKDRGKKVAPLCAMKYGE
jgi:hypothetical protein